MANSQSYQVDESLPGRSFGDNLIVTDEELLRVHQRKSAARIAEISRSLEDVRSRPDNAAPLKMVRRPDTVLLAFLAERYNLQRWRHRSGALGIYLEEQHASLLRERCALVHPITLEAFASSRIRRLPIDVMIEIFMTVKAMADDTLADEAMAPRSPLDKISGIYRVGDGSGPLLSRVCAKWRAIACNHSPLWSSFSFGLFETTSVDMVDLYLVRSKSAPLTVEIDVTRQHFHDRAIGERVIERIATDAHRLLELRFFWRSYFLPPLPLLQPLRGRLAALEILQIPVWPELSNEFESVPVLHTLRLCNSNEMTETQHNFDRSQIRDLTIFDPTGTQLLAYPNLTGLMCIETQGPYDQAAVSVPVTLPGLTTLKVEYCGNRSTNPEISNIFHRFDSPALRSLDAQFLGQAADLTAFLRRSQCSLTELVLRDLNLRVSKLLDVLALTPALESLAAIGGMPTMVTDKLLHHLAICADNSLTNLPRLRSLTLNGSFAFGDASLLDMLETRTVHKAATSHGRFVGLQDVFLSLPYRAISDGAVERLRSLKGVRVHLECLDSSKAMIRVV